MSKVKELILRDSGTAPVAAKRILSVLLHAPGGLLCNHLRTCPGAEKVVRAKGEEEPRIRLLFSKAQCVFDEYMKT